MAKDKEKVIDEVWTEARIREFLDIKPAAGIDADFHRLQKAYHSMRADNFADFVTMFVADGHNINACDPWRRTVLSYALEHRNSAEFVAVLQRNGAQ